jgi:hypothetical protein
MAALHDQVDRLRAALGDEKARAHQLQVASSHASIARINLLTTLRIARINVDDDLNTRQVSNAVHVIGDSKLGVPIESLFGTDDAERYFEQIRYLCDYIPRVSVEAGRQPWKQVFPPESSSGASLETWLPKPENSWDAKPNMALTRYLPHAVEYFLSSPTEIIGPEDDFRIEYMACTSSSPRDLSVVVAGKLDVLPLMNQYTTRPEDVGYCFAFGCMDNACTELQRMMLTVAVTEEVKIVPGRNHHCVAERIGGLLRLLIDGKEAYRYVDPLPLIGPGRGYVTLYSYGPDHLFWDLRILTRPTCIPAETRQQIEELRSVTLESRGDRFVEAHMLHRNLFAFKDVTDAIKTRRELEERRQRAEQMEESLSQANAAAREMNQPLAIILGQIESLMGARNAKAQSTLKEGLADLKRNSERLAEIVRKLSQV